jgi:Prokaryotic glutathione synthetase, ATP-grasp domain
VPTGNDPRANISAGGRSVPLEIGDVERGVIEAMSKKLVADGMYFVGIDVIGDKVVEINAESPGGMQSVEGSTRSTSAQPSSKPWSAAPARSPEQLRHRGSWRPGKRGRGFVR